MAEQAQVVNSRMVYAGRVFDVYVDEVDVGMGETTHREVVRHPGAVAMVAVRDDGRVVMVTQYRHPTAKRLLEIPAGTLNPGEEPLAAAERELQEEIGQRPGRIEAMGGFYVAPGYADEYIRLYFCTQLEESQLDRDDDEDIEVVELTMAEALAAIESGDIEDAKTIVGLLRWAQR